MSYTSKCLSLKVAEAWLFGTIRMGLQYSSFWKKKKKSVIVLSVKQSQIYLNVGPWRYDPLWIQRVSSESSKQTNTSTMRIWTNAWVYRGAFKSSIFEGSSYWGCSLTLRGSLKASLRTHTWWLSCLEEPLLSLWVGDEDVISLRLDCCLATVLWFLWKLQRRVSQQSREEHHSELWRPRHNSPHCGEGFKRADVRAAQRLHNRWIRPGPDREESLTHCVAVRM